MAILSIQRIPRLFVFLSHPKPRLLWWIDLKTVSGQRHGPASDLGINAIGENLPRQKVGICFWEFV